MAKAVLVVGGGIETLQGILRAKEMGFEVIVSDGNPKAPGFALADHRIVVSTYDIAGTVWEAKKLHKTVRKIDGVICIGTDVPLTVATVAHELGLPGISVESARLSADKLAMKQKFASDGIPVPWFSPVTSVDHLHEIVTERGYGLVLKPVDSRGARGVLRLSESLDFQWAYSTALKHSPTGRVMVEQYLDGPQVSTESMVLDGRAYTVGFSDRNYELLEVYAPHIIENGGELPSCLPSKVQETIQNLIAEAAKSIGITNGVLKGDIVVHSGVPYIIEVAARLSGGYFCTHEIPLNTGVDFVGQAIRLALGEKPRPEDLSARFCRPVAQRYLFPKPGIVKRISGVEAVKNRPGISLCEVRVSVGDIISEIDCHPARAGVVIAVGDSREQAIERATEAVRDIHIQTAPIHW